MSIKVGDRVRYADGVNVPDGFHKKRGKVVEVIDLAANPERIYVAWDQEDGAPEGIQGGLLVRED